MHSGRKLMERLASAEKIIRETPVIPLRDQRIDLFAKLEYLNGIGSVKDRPAFWILKGAIQRGEVGPGTTVIESSSGNFACALAAFCKMLELDFIPVIDPNISPYSESVLRSQCARVVKVEDADDSGGFLKTRLETVQELLKEIPDSYWPNQYGNPDGMAAHYYLTGEEIARSVPRLDYIFLGVSSAGTVAGVSQRIRERIPAARIIAVDAEGSVIFGQPPQTRWIPGLGSSITPPLLRHAIIDEVAVVREVDTIAACHELLDRHGLFAGGSTGTVYSAIQRYFSGMKLRARPRVLFLCCDRGTAYLPTIYDRRWAAWRARESAPVACASFVYQCVSEPSGRL
jgi:2,3-diaminopropionate biosynthesis protein SbnA